MGAGTHTFAPTRAFLAELAKRDRAARPPIVHRTRRRRVCASRRAGGRATSGPICRSSFAPRSTAQHPIFCERWESWGHRLKTIEVLINQRDHGISPHIRELGAQGLTGLSPDDLIRTRNNGVSPEHERPRCARLPQPLARRVDPPAEQRVCHRICATSARSATGIFARRAGPSAKQRSVTRVCVRDQNRALGYQSLARPGGPAPFRRVPDYVRELKDLGYDQLALDELVVLRPASRPTAFGGERPCRPAPDRRHAQGRCRERLEEGRAAKLRTMTMAGRGGTMNSIR